MFSNFLVHGYFYPFLMFIQLRIKCDALPCDKLEEADTLVRNLDVIGIDEGQFVGLFGL